MTAKNLSICFGPNLLFCRVETAETVIGDAIYVTDLTAMLIENPEFFFKKILSIVCDLEDDVDDVISLQEINTLTPEELKQREIQIEQKRKERIEKRKENIIKIEEQNKLDEELKRKRHERKKLFNQQWEQKIEESTNNQKIEEKTSEELEKQRVSRLEKKKTIKSTMDR